LKNVDGSKDDPVQNGGDWAQTNHFLETTLELLKDQKDDWYDSVFSMCPGDQVAGAVAVVTIPVNIICKAIVIITWYLFSFLKSATYMVRTEA
jgi:hypothetical protein